MRVTEVDIRHQQVGPSQSRVRRLPSGAVTSAQCLLETIVTLSLAALVGVADNALCRPTRLFGRDPSVRDASAIQTVRPAA